MSGYKRGDSVTATHTNGSIVIGTVATVVGGAPTHLLVDGASVDVTGRGWKIPVPVPTGKWAMVVPPKNEELEFPLVLQPVEPNKLGWYQGATRRTESYVSDQIAGNGWTVRSEGIES